jgi:hypothetical protein
MNIHVLLYKLRNIPHRLRGWRQEIYHLLNIGNSCELSLTVFRADGKVYPLGVVCRRMVTDVGAQYIRDSFMNTVELEAMNAHGIGTTSTAESAADTALGGEVETRVSGTQSTPAANQYRSTGTITATATRAIVEHGLFNSTTVSGSKLFDRSVFSVVNLSSGDSIQCQYTVTIPSGG